MIKLYNLLVEAQQFDLDSKKVLIFKFIDMVRAGKKLGEYDNPFYKIIAGDPKVTTQYSQEQKNGWKNYFSQKPFYTDGVWSQIEINPNFEKPTKSEGRTLNRYVTVNNDKENVAKFFKGLGVLNKYLNQISNQYQSPIAYKTHRLLDAFITHNDSLKVYFYDPKLKEPIDNAIKQWAQTTGIELGERSHEFGVDIKGQSSYGMILSRKVGDAFANLIKQYGDKYTNEQYFLWIKKYLPNIIKQYKPKEFNG